MSAEQKFHRWAQIILSAYGLWLMAYGCCYAELHNYVRVAILQDALSFNLKVSGFYEIQDSENQRVLYQGKTLKTTVATYKEGILIGELNANTDKLYIKPENPEAIVINGRRFRGNIQLIKKDNLRLTVINYLDLEDYIKGILYHEVSHYWPQEVLKAQAVAARTFAVFQVQVNAQKDFDVTSDIYSQVYGGRTSERIRTNKAVNETNSLALVFQDKIFPAYYHATCGGRTEDAFLLWNTNIPALKGVFCDFCKNSPHYQWHCVLSKKEIKEILKKSGYNGFKEIKDILILGRNPSGRVTDLKISTDKKEIEIPAKDFRNICGPNIIRSANFEVNAVDSDTVFTGLGWGHGVGMCQWGAYFMAKQGRNYQEILEYYYPQTDVKTIGF